MRLTERTIFITGGASGIGLGLATRFRDRGNRVIVAGRRESALAEASGLGLETYRADVADEAERLRMADELPRIYPDLDVLVNNAGIQLYPPVLPESQDWAEHRRELATNLEAPMHLTHLFAAHLAAKNGTLINVTSGLAFVPIYKMPTYCLTKAALHSFTLSVREQLKGKVEVVEIAPPAVDTDLGGPGLHTFGEPLDAFCDHCFVKLEAGETEFGYNMSERARTADRAGLDAMFAHMAATR